MLRRLHKIDTPYLYYVALCNLCCPLLLSQFTLDLILKSRLVTPGYKIRIYGFFLLRETFWTIKKS